MIDLNDPRLTAFALGELEAGESQEIEAAVQAAPELQREVAAIRQAAQSLQAALGAEACPTLTDAQRAAIEAESDAAAANALATDALATDALATDAADIAQPATGGLPVRPSGHRWSVRRSITLAVSACLLLAALAGPALFRSNFAPTSLARQEATETEGSELWDETPADELSSAETPLEQAASGSEPPPSYAAPAPDSYGAYAAGGDDGFGDHGEDRTLRSLGRDGQPRAADPESRRFEFEMRGRDLSRLHADGEEERLGVEPALEAKDESPSPFGGESDARGLWYGRAVTDDEASRPTDGPRPATPRELSNRSEPIRFDFSEPSEALPAGAKPDMTLELGDVGGEAVIRTPARLTPGQQENRAAPAEEASRLATNPRADSLAVQPAKPDGATSSGQSAPSGSPGETRLLTDLSNAESLGEVASEDGASAGKARAKAVRGAAERGETKALDLAKRANNKSTWRRSRATPNASQLMIGDQDGLPLEGMQVNVLVDGFRARVLLDLYYYNNRGNRLEGNFKLRLPNEASLYYFAFGQSAYEYRPMVDQLASKGFLSGDLIRAASLDPLGIMKSRADSWTDVKEARVVPREKAAHAYSETVRRRVDPALVEWSGAGVFNARVFPLMPHKLHRVVVGYDVTLQQLGDDLVYALDLPVEQGECVVDLNVSALPGVTAEVTPSARPFMSGGRAYYNFKDPADQAINVRFKNAGSMLLTGSDGQAGEFFVTRLTPELPSDEQSASSPRAMFLVDTSLSSRPEKFNVWLEMLEAVLTENRDSIDEFAVLFFNIETHWWQPGYRKNNAENVARLVTDCQALSLEGATDLRQALGAATAPEWAPESAVANAPRPDLFLLSDGAVTWGEMNVHRLSQELAEAGSGPLFAYQTGLTGTAVGTLEHLTRETGGAVFSVVNEDEIKQVARAHRLRPWRLLDVALPGGSDVLVAGRPKFLYPGQSLLVAGRGQPDAEATVRVRRGDQQQVVEVTIDRRLESALAPRVYGQVSVGQLEDLGGRVEDVAIAYARHFRVTGQTCSLLMLESEADYKRFNIKPEEDALLVRTSPSADLIAAKLDELAEQLGDAKTAMTDWLSKLERTPGLQFTMPTALRLVVDRLPSEAFEVETARLVCSQPRDEDTPRDFLRRLDSGRLDYAAVTRRADSRFQQEGAADALRTLSSLVENNPGDPVLTRDVAFSALEWGLGGQAFHLLKRVSELRPYEPQTYQAMSLCLAETGNADLAMLYYEVALNATWHNRYLDVKQIVGVEYVDLLRRIERGEVSSHARPYAVARLESIRGRVPVSKADLVVTMMWNTDRTDVDLHVIEPTGEECYYEHPRTRMGGQMTRDVTEGFGPEMYTLPKAKAGEYRILANYFGSDANRTSVRSKVYVTVYRNYGDPKRQMVERKTITLADQKEKRELVTVKIKR